MSTLITRKKKMGRPPVDSTEVSVRMVRADLEQVDNWREKEPDLPGRPEAIRRLVKKALAE